MNLCRKVSCYDIAHYLAGQCWGNLWYTPFNQFSSISYIFQDCQRHLAISLYNVHITIELWSSIEKMSKGRTQIFVSWFSFLVTALFRKHVYLKTSCLCNHTKMPCFWIHENERANVIRQLLNVSQDVGCVQLPEAGQYFCIFFHYNYGKCPLWCIWINTSKDFLCSGHFLFIADGQIQTELNSKIV